MHEAGRGAFSPDGGSIVYNRIAREDRTWKRYLGGMAQDLWLYDFATRDDRKLTDYRGTDRLPMWIGDDDLLRFGPRRRAQHLALRPRRRFADSSDPPHRLRRPAAERRRGLDRLRGGRATCGCWTRQAARPGPSPIEIPTAPRETRPYRKTVDDFITHVGVAPEGGRALVSARGEVFTVPFESGPTRNLTRSPGARDRGARVVAGRLTDRLLLGSGGRIPALHRRSSRGSRSAAAHLARPRLAAHRAVVAGRREDRLHRRDAHSVRHRHRNAAA